MSKVLAIQGSASALRNSIGDVSTELSGQPAIGDFLVATSLTAATWSTVAIGSGNMVGVAPSVIGGLVEYTAVDGINTADSGVLTADLITENTFLAKGDLISASATGVSAVVGIGASDGQVLTVNAADPNGMVWATPVKHDFTVRTVGGTGNVLLTDDIINVSNFGAVATMTLPDSSLSLGKSVIFIKQFADDVIVSTFNAGDKIVNGGVEVDSLTLTGAIHERLHLINNGTNLWFVM